jgi:dihydrolipoamide dehydrogenase
MYDLTVIGAGPGGYEAAAHAAKNGKKVALIEKERLGGGMPQRGLHSAKTFLRSSKLFHECSKAAGPTASASSRCPSTCPRWSSARNRVVGTLAKGVEGMLKRAGVETHQRHRESSRLATPCKSAEQLYKAHNILIATGSRPAVPPISEPFDPSASTIPTPSSA